jgi:hypothetical protein
MVPVFQKQVVSALTAQPAAMPGGHSLQTLLTVKAPL